MKSMKLKDLLAFAPKTWREQYEATAGVPTSGPIADVHGVVHEILGDYTVCSRAWTKFNAYNQLLPAKGWTLLPAGTAFTCIACLRDIPMSEG